MKPLYEAHRPQSWDEVVGQDKAVSKLLALKERVGLAGRAYWISGQSGTGKTTIARLIAAAPKLLEACEQARAALPDAWLAESNGVPRELIDLLDAAIAKAKARGQQ